MMPSFRLSAHEHLLFLGNLKTVLDLVTDQKIDRGKLQPKFAAIYLGCTNWLVIPSKSAASLRTAQDDSSGVCHPERELWIAVAHSSKSAPSRGLANCWGITSNWLLTIPSK